MICASILIMSVCVSYFQDILAVAYGEFNFSNQKNGIACCWSLKNPEVNIGIKYFYYVCFLICVKTFRICV